MATTKKKALPKAIAKKKTVPKKDNTEKEKCGIIMPISAIDGCSEAHWSDVLEIISESIEEAGFDANIVSNADDTGVIQKRIIQNLYDNPIVICDVSGKNPNVMFELGIRLAFDKPTIIIKDDKTDYSFDTSPIEHLSYPRDLRFNSIIDFKDKLSEKITNTYNKAKTDKSYSTFLKHFGEFKISKIEQKEVTSQEYLLEEIKSLKLLVESKVNNYSYTKRKALPTKGVYINICLKNESKNVDEIVSIISKLVKVEEIQIKTISPNHIHLNVFPKNSDDIIEVRSEIISLLSNYNVIVHKLHRGGITK